MAQIKNHVINLNVTLATFRDYLSLCIKAIISRRGLYPTDTFQRADQGDVMEAVARDDKIARYIDKVVSDALDMIVKKNKTVVTVCVSSLDSKSIENWNIYINVLYFKQATASTENFAPKLMQYLDQIILGAGPYPQSNQPYFFNLMLWVNYPFN